jgi:hypothetical protein
MPHHLDSASPPSTRDPYFTDGARLYQATLVNGSGRHGVVVLEDCEEQRWSVVAPEDFVAMGLRRIGGDGTPLIVPAPKRRRVLARLAVRVVRPLTRRRHLRAHGASPAA